MEYVGDLYGLPEIVQDVPVYGNAAAIGKGAVVIRGTTNGTNINFAILGTGALTDVIGVLYEALANTVAGDDTNAGGTNYTLRRCIISPFGIFRAEFDQTDTMAIASTTATTVTVTSGETNLQGGYLYATGGTGVGSLQLITTDDGSGAYTTKGTHGWDTTTTLIKIVPQWHQVIKVNTAATMIGSDAAAGTGTVSVRRIWIKADSIALAELHPVLHSGLTGLDSLNVKFYADIVFRNHVFNTLD